MAQQAGTRIVNGITTRVLHGKDYVEVNERLRILNELKKAGEITDFEMVESQPYQFANRWVWRVSAKISGKLYIGNAEIKQDAPKNTPDGTNPIECAETSAFGRMLAFAGLGTIESIASYEEVVRGKPFVAVIEQAQDRVIESNAPKQLPQVKPAPTVEQLRERALGLYEVAVKKGQIKEDSTGGTFLKLACDVCQVKIASIGQLTISRLDAIEKYLESVK